MASPQTSLLAAVLFPAFLVLHSSSSLPHCPQSCICENAPLLNCSSSGLSVVPRLLQGSVSELDLSHNLLSSVALHQTHYNLRNVWLGNNSITYLSLCMERHLKDPFLRRRFRTRSRPGCQTWAPALQLLSAERNLLEQLPEGLDGVRSLQVLQLSFNRISTLQPEVLSRLRQLKELHLKHNLITHLHPQMFQSLDQLRVLDLSFNMVTSLHPLMYLTLRSIGTDVQLGGNRWRCNCSMRNLQRRMAYDSSKGLQAWTIVCAFPSTVLGRDLLQMQEEDFDCLNSENSPDLHHDVTVYSGSEILLSCSAQESMLWTPSGEGSVSQQNAGLLISDVSHSNTGLYVCVSEEDQVVSVFNLQISKTGGARKARSLPETHHQSLLQSTLKREGEKQASPTHSDLALAVSLSVVITFLIAFILGVLARPCIDWVWKRVTNKKSPSAIHTVSSTEQSQHDNEAFSNAEEQEDPGPFRERRVTFSTVDFIEDSNVPYYDTVANDDQGSITNDEVIECEVAVTEVHEQNAGDSGSLQCIESKQSDDSGSNDSNERHSKNVQCQHIPDPSELERISLSSSSDSSSSEKISEEDQLIKIKHTEINSPQLTEDSIQQRPDFSKKTEITQSSMEGKSEMPGFSSEPSLQTKNTKLLDSDALQDNGNLFEFSDYAESPTGMSSSIFEMRSQEPTSDKQKMEDMSSSSSYISEDEPTHYTVNSDPETEESDSSEASVRAVDQVKSSLGTKRPAMRPDYSFSSDSSESDEDPMQNRRKQEQMNEGHEGSNSNKTNLSSGIVTAERDSWKKKTPMSLPQYLSIDLGQITQIRRRLDFKVPSPSPDSSYSSDSEDETKGYIKKQEQEVVHTSMPPITVSQTVTNKPENQWPSIDHGQVTKNNRRLDIKAPSASDDSHSSSDSEDETKRHTKYEEQKEMQLSSPSNKASQMMTKEPGNQWPIVDLVQITRLKRRIDIKAPSPSSDSSSNSDSEDETTGHVKKQEQEEVHTSRPPIKTYQTVTKEPENQWPTVDLGQMTQIRRRIDFKAQSPGPDSSSCSDSEEETKGNIKYLMQEEVHMTRPPMKVPQPITKDPENQWPTVDLGQIRLKRRLDIKVPSQSSDSSSSSDSEEETKGHMLKQETEKVHITRPPIKVSQTVIEEPGNQWPTIDLGHVTKIKRRIDFKAPSQSSDSSSSSESEDETTDHIKKLGLEEVHMTRPPIKVSQTVTKEPENQWPIVDLGQIRLKRRLDIKVPSQSSDSSSGSDSEEETKGHMLKQETEKVHMTRPPIKGSQTVTKEPENQWPIVDLGLLRLKRRLDFKAPSQSLDLSSSSDSEDETTGPPKKLKQEEVHLIRPPIKVSQTVIKEPGNQWPIVDLGQVIQIKRRLDFKAPSQSSDSSSSSESEDETTGHIKKLEQEEVQMTRPSIKVPQTVTKEPENQWPTVDLGLLQIKRRLDFKVPSQSPDLSSGSDSEDDTKGKIKNQLQEEVHMTRPPLKVSQTITKVPENQWPTVDLGQVTRIKRRLDFKAPSQSSDSSSSNESEEKLLSHIKKQEQEQMHKSQPPSRLSQTVNKVPENQWPTVDLGQITRIKRRLDIKAPSKSPALASSDSRDETTSQIKKLEQEKEFVTWPPIKVLQTVTKEPENQWPTVDLGRIRLKRRLDFKATPQSLDSSSRSDSEDDTKGYIKKQEQEQAHLTSSPIKAFQIVTKVPKNQWATVDLGQVTQIKRRLDFKAPSQSSELSESEEKAVSHIKKQEQEKVYVSHPPSKLSQTVAKVPENQWPTVDLGQITRIKRRLDIKAPSQSFDSFSSNENKDKAMDHMKKQEQEEIHMSRPSNKVSQIVIKEPENKWPIVDLGQLTHIKRRLDFKVPSSSPGSSFCSDMGDETKDYIKKQEQEQAHLTSSPIKAFQIVTKVPKNQWPTVDLGQVTQIKRRLDFKAPSQSSDLSSSKESEEKVLSHTKKQEQEQVHMALPPSKLSQTVTKVPENQWSTADLGQITRIKRRLDIKAPSQSFDSFTSIENKETSMDHIKKQEKEEIHMSRPPIKVSQTAIEEPGNQWPIVDLGQVTQIKRRLDFKALSSHPGSSSSRDSEDQTKGYIKKQEQEQAHLTSSPIKAFQIVTKVPKNQWPTVDLGQVTQIKRRLDIKAPSPSFDSFSSIENKEKAMDYIKKQEQEEIYMPRPSIKVSRAAINEPGNQCPIVDLGHVTQIKRRLDFKVPSSSSDSSCTYGTEDKTTGHTTRPPINISQTVTKEPENHWPSVSLGDITKMKRRLDIKASSLGLPSSRYENEDENQDFQAQARVEISAKSTTENNVIRSSEVPVLNLVHTPRKDYNIKLEKYNVFPDNLESKPTNDTINATADMNPELQSRWATMNLGISRFRKRLEITSPSTEPDNLSSPPSSDTGPGRRPRLYRKIVGMQETDLSPVFGNKPLNVSVTMKDPHDKYSSSDDAIPSVTEEEKTEPDAALNYLGSQHVKRYEDIWVGEKVSASASQHHPHSSSSSDSEDETINQNVPDLSLGVPRIKRRLNIKAPSLEPSNAPSFSKSEKDVTGYSELQSQQISTVLETTDESLITYKRSIIKGSSLSRNSFPPSGRSQTVDHTSITQESDINASLVPRIGSSMTFDDIIKSKVKQSRSNTDMDLPHEIRWTGVGHHLPDLSTSKLENLHSASTSLQQTPVTELFAPSLDSSSSTRGVFGVSPLKARETSGTVSEDRGRRGLGALKAMSLERRMWETDLDEDPSASSDHYDPQGDTGRFIKDTDVLPEETLKDLPSLEKTRDADLLLLYGVPRYKGHGIKKPTQEPRLPVPETPPPEY